MVSELYQNRTAEKILIKHTYGAYPESKCALGSVRQIGFLQPSCPLHRGLPERSGGWGFVQFAIVSFVR